MSETAYEPIHYDFTNLLDASTPILLRELAETHSTIASLHVQIAFLKEEEERGAAHAKVLRREMEGTRDAYIEKKWLIVKLLEHNGK